MLWGKIWTRKCEHSCAIIPGDGRTRMNMSAHYRAAVYAFGRSKIMAYFDTRKKDITLIKHERATI